LNPELRKRRNKKFVQSLTKHLRMGEEQAERLARRFRRQNSDPFSFGPQQESMRFPSSGARKALVILIQYPDLANEHSTADFNSLMNEENYSGTGSFRDFFLKNSYGQLDINADVFGWYTAENNYDYYGYLNGFQRSRVLMAEAIDAAEAAGVDFSQYDNDGDGKVDAVIGVHAGPGAEMGAQLQYIWSHRWTLGTYERNYDGVEISDYIINPETRPWGMVGIGVFCHEFGHALGLPDLYDADNSSRGIGNWGIMGNGAWLNQEKVPSNMNAWCKEDMSWLTPEVITEGSYSLESVDGHAACYRINTPDPNEYFLLENRQQVGNDTHLPGTGLAIWHIDKEKTALYPASNSVNADETNKGVDLEEADGLDQLDNDPFQGDNGDLFPGSSMRTFFTAESAPSSNLYDGTASGISVTNIYEQNGIVHFRLNDPAVCGIANVIPGDKSNCGSGTYDQDLIVYYEFPPEEGMLVVNDHQFEATSSPQTVTLTGLPADGQTHDVTAYFIDVQGCSAFIESVFTAPMSYEVVLETTTCDPAQAGQQQLNLQTVDGCDSSVLIITTLLPSYNRQIISTTCLEAEAGTTVLELQTAEGCDSTITFIVNYEPVLTTTIESTTCDPAAAGVESFVFQTEDGCDSIVTYNTILLETSRQTITRVSCDPDEVGVELFQYEADNGCDSTVVVRTSLVPSYELVVEETTCDPSATGTVSELHSTVFGCDSMVTTISTYEAMEISFELEIDENRISLTNNSVNADHFLWLFGDGNFYIGSDPEHQYRQPGLYFVLLMGINDECGSFDATGKWIVIEEIPDVQDNGPDEFVLSGAREGSMEIYPNPTFGPVHVETEGLSGQTAQMSLIDINGKLVMSEEMSNINSTSSMDLSSVGPGIYTMQINDGEQVVNKRVFLTN